VKELAVTFLSAKKIALWQEGLKLEETLWGEEETPTGNE
jgi:hypothetical protein